MVTRLIENLKGSKINRVFALSSDFCLLTLVGSQCFIWHSCNAVARYFARQIERILILHPICTYTLCKLFLKAFVHYIFAAFTSHPISPNYFFFFLFQADAINAGIGGKKVVFLGSIVSTGNPRGFFQCTFSKREIQIKKNF